VKPQRRYALLLPTLWDGEPFLELGAASLRVPASIQVATCTGWTALIAGTPPLAHQA
jgi:hypothetical protein